jgi:hypothetical protein
MDTYFKQQLGIPEAKTIDELEIKQLRQELESYQEDGIYFREVISSMYQAHVNAYHNMKSVDRFKEARFHLGNALAFRASPEHFDNIRKIRG